jgi:predicted permease
MMATALQDLRFGWRMLLRSPGVSLLAILCLTLGIGANAAVFSWIEGILIRPFPLVRHQERLLAVSGTARGVSGATDLSWPDFVDFQRSCRRIELIADKITGTTLSIGARAERATGSIVSVNYFAALGIRLAMGRGFAPDEAIGRNAHPVTVISDQMWRDRYGADPHILGRTQILNGFPHTIIGVAPPGFHGTFVGYAIQFWVPASMQERFDAGGYKLEDRGARWIEGFARLAPGATREQAQQEIAAVAERLERDHPATNRGCSVRLAPLWLTPFNKASELLPTLGIALGVVFLVLLIACANVSNLLLVRALGRRQEITLRLAVGCARRRLVRQLLTESLLLAALAAGGGLLLALACRPLLAAFFDVPSGVVLHLAGQLDWRVLAASAAVGTLAILLFGLAPALQSSRVDLAAALRSAAGGVVGGHGRARLRSGLVVLQVSLSCALLIAASLVVRSLLAMRAASPGFAVDGVLTAGLDLFAAGYDLPRAGDFEDRLVERVRALPGVRSAALARLRPLSYQPYSSAPLAVPGYVPDPGEQPAAELNEVGPAYFTTLGIPLVAGREFSRADGATTLPVAIVNTTMAARYWHGVDPLGKRFQAAGRWLQVVGVAATARVGKLVEPPQPFFYVPLRQQPSRRAVLLLRTGRSPGALAPAMVRELRALDPALAPQELVTMRQHVDRSAAPQRIAVTLLGAFGGLALLLSAIGLYGVMSVTVAQRRRELGLRLALGARAVDLFRLVAAHGAALTAAGLLLGGAVALATTRLLRAMLYQVSPRDPWAFAAAFLVMSVVAAAACCLPAWRAPQIDPLRALLDP